LNDRIRQVLVGLVMIPLSLLPFVIYFRRTPEGRLLWTRTIVRVAPPRLPRITLADVARYRRLAPHWRGAAAVLVYHGIGSSVDAEGRFSVSAGRFGEQLQAMRAAGYHFVTARDLAAARRGHRPLPADAVMITFDDGRSEAMMLADPLLRQAGARATMFVITGRSHDPGLFYTSAGKLRAYAATGRWDLESHTDALHAMQRTRAGDLPLLTSLRNGESIVGFGRRVAADLDRADAEIVSITGRSPVAFAYPFGAYGADRTNDARIIGVLRDVLHRRYQIAFEQDDQRTVPLAGCGRYPLRIRRLDALPWSGEGLLRQLRRLAAHTPIAGRCPTA
jgi:peptidoglycan/xylan/chitin deacetylase (PgdA/CDA1 family)